MNSVGEIVSVWIGVRNYIAVWHCFYMFQLYEFHNFEAQTLVFISKNLDD